jgi:hypothetical protein
VEGINPGLSTERPEGPHDTARYSAEPSRGIFNTHQVVQIVPKIGVPYFVGECNNHSTTGYYTLQQLCPVDLGRRTSRFWHFTFFGFVRSCTITYKAKKTKSSQRPRDMSKIPQDQIIIFFDPFQYYFDLESPSSYMLFLRILRHREYVNLWFWEGRHKLICVGPRNGALELWISIHTNLEPCIFLLRSSSESDGNSWLSFTGIPGSTHRVAPCRQDPKCHLFAELGKTFQIMGVRAYLPFGCIRMATNYVNMITRNIHDSPGTSGRASSVLLINQAPPERPLEHISSTAYTLLSCCGWILALFFLQPLLLAHSSPTSPTPHGKLRVLNGCTKEMATTDK